MAITIQLATFSKRENSTAQYAGTWTDFSCTLKDNCSVINPRIELHTATNVTAFNYAHISAFNRYYFIRDIEYYREETILYLECDVLATYKSTIGSSSEYILRSASNYDGTIIDTLYPAKTVCTIVEGTSVGVFSTADITFILGVINNESSNKAGAVQYYAMDATQMHSFMEFLLGDDSAIQMDSFLSTISNLSQAVQDGVARSMINPASYIVESYALPYAPDVDQLSVVKCGWWTIAETGYVIRPRTNHIDIGSGTFTLNLPRHPQASTRGDYLNCAPYTRYTLLLGPFGVYSLDSTKCASVSSVNCKVYGDNFGNVTCEIELGGVIVDRLTACVKNPFAVGQVNVDALSAMSSGVAIACDLQKNIGNPDEKTFNAGNVMSAVNALMPQVTRQGAQGNFSNVFPNFRSIAEHYTIADDDLTHRGRPLCQQKTISTLSGYVLVSDADISIAGTKQENEQIKSYMNNGFYYE